jgi:hypothetical protein
MTIRICTGCDEEMYTASQPHPAGVRLYRGRGLCISCYEKAKYRGDLIDYERKNWPMDWMIAEYRRIRGDQFTLADAARQIGVTRASLEKALQRARQKGLLAA